MFQVLEPHKACLRAEVIDADYPFVCYCDDAGVCAVDVAVTKCFKKPNAAGRWSAVRMGCAIYRSGSRWPKRPRQRFSI